MPALWEEGEGIAQTHVTAEDIENAFQEQFNVKAKFGANYKISDIGAGKGFVSKTLVIDPDWVDDDGTLPKQFVVKICSMLPVAEWDPSAISFHIGNLVLENGYRVVHNVECQFYKLANKYGNEGLKIPKYFGSQLYTEQQTSKGLVALEYFNDSESAQVYNSLKVEEAKQLLPNIIALEQLGQKFSQEEFDEWNSRKFFKDVVGPFCTGDLLPKFIADVLRFLGDDKTGISAKFPAIAEDLFTDEWLNRWDNLADSLGMPKVLVHGDLWCNNTLWKKNAQGGLDLKAVIDFQWSHVGCGTFDLAMVLCAFLSGRDRRKHTETIMQEFYDQLMEKLGTKLFSFEQFRKSFEYLFLMNSLLISCTLSAVYLEKVDKEEKDLPPREEVLEKLTFLVEDLIAVYEKLQEEIKQNRPAEEN